MDVIMIKNKEETQKRVQHSIQLLPTSYTFPERLASSMSFSCSLYSALPLQYNSNLCSNQDIFQPPPV
ncbi:unnamed protein product [Linum trigynum]|uniref:Uncharacterized protein n=1 Tax=Linum trigynum TaxID=586398 RepID=A0AAV2G6G5_9ROSI